MCKGTTKAIKALEKLGFVLVKQSKHIHLHHASGYSTIVSRSIRDFEVIVKKEKTRLSQFQKMKGIMS